MTIVPFLDMTIELSIKCFYIPLQRTRCYHLIFVCDNRLYKKTKFNKSYIKLFGEV